VEGGAGKKMRVYMAVLNYSSKLHWQVTISLVRLIAHEVKKKRSNYETVLEIIPRMRAPRVRNYVGHQCLKLDADYLLTIDDDHVFAHDALERLIAHDLDVVGALAFLRNEDNSSGLTPSMYKRGRDHPPGYTRHDDWKLGELVEVDAMGMAFVLIKRRVLEAFKHPWWWLGSLEEPLGEDIYFCRKAQEAGFKLYVDTSLEVPHLSERILLHSGMWKQEKEDAILESAG